MNANRPRRVVIVGGVAGGMSAATRLRRLDETAEIIVLERGPYVSFANCGLPYYVGGVITERDDLVLQTPAALTRRFNLDVRTGHEVRALDPDRNEVTVTASDQSYCLPFDDLILAPGAAPIVPPIPGIERALTLRSIPDVDRIMEGLNTGVKSVAVIGAGFIGVEIAENLARRGLHVSLLEAANQILPPFDPEMTVPLASALAEAGVDLVLNARVTAVGGDTVSFEAAGERAAAGHEGGSVPADLVICAIGVRPDTGFLAASGVELSERGAIRVDDYCRTSRPNVWAVGDGATKRHRITGAEVLVPLANSANRDGRLVATNICATPVGHSVDPTALTAAAPVLGTAIIGVGEIAAGVTGLTEAAARAAGFDIDVIHTHPFDHVTYYPGAHQIALKLVINRADGTILGAQASGGAGVARRIDVLATAIVAKLPATTLGEIDLAYAPQFGAAKDAVTMLGFVAQNLDANLTPNTTEAGAGKVLLDVRTPAEFARGAIPGAVNIELDTLRERIGEVQDLLSQAEHGQAEYQVVVYCAVGVRAHSATRILRAHGIEAVNLSGGWRTWQARTRAASLAAGGE